MKKTKILILLLCTLFLFPFLFPQQVTAAEESGLTITVDEGFDGKVKRGEGFPVELNIENAGEDFSGSLLVSFYPSYNSGGSIPVKIEVPAGETRSFQLSLPAMTEDHQSYYQNEPSIHLFKGDWKDGKQLTYKGDKAVKPKFIDDATSFIGVLSENYDRLKELRTTASATMAELQPEQIPVQAMGLETLDAIIVDEFSLAQLTDAQQTALKEWIKVGGTLIAGAAPDAQATYGQLYDLLPMKPDTEAGASSQFLKLGSSIEELPFNELPFFTGEVAEEAEVLVQNGELPAVVRSLYGSGMILQSSFSLGDEPLSSWTDYDAWFVNLLKFTDAGQSSNANMHGGFYDSLYWEFAEANEFFPASNVSIEQLITLLAIYIVIVVPVLYFILRKIDKREHSWWVIPALSIVMAAIIFTIGAKDRISQAQLNQMGVFYEENNQLAGLQAATLLSNTGGEYSIEYPSGTFRPVSGGGGNSTYDPMRGAIFADQVKTDSVIFPKVDYWSTKTIYGKANQPTEGGFTSDLTLSDKILTGTITNHYDYDFSEVFIWSGSQKVKLGALKSGETLEVNKQLKQSILMKPTSNGYGGINYGQTDINMVKCEQLEYSAVTYVLNEHMKTAKPVIAGLTTQPVIDITVADKNEKQNNMNLILSSADVQQNITGSFTLKQDALTTDLEVISGQIYEEMIHGSNYEVNLDNGEYEYTFELPEQLKGKEITLTELKLAFRNPTIDYSLLNAKTGEWLTLESDKTATLKESESVNDYISAEGAFVLKLVKNTGGDPYVQMPNISIKGEVAP
ncbi:hypothetical protein [Cytobacillus gottheilii]|uniref:hypothetical protein n=1 Tax=Cytobacillus gottheilii TaxID=859144 RepID=UPI0009BBBD36|nr:hypothetical protein [Cytobacillus gottheilii]